MAEVKLIIFPRGTSWFYSKSQFWILRQFPSSDYHDAPNLSCGRNKVNGPNPNELFKPQTRHTLQGGRATPSPQMAQAMTDGTRQVKKSTLPPPPHAKRAKCHKWKWHQSRCAWKVIVGGKGTHVSELWATLKLTMPLPTRGWSYVLVQGFTEGFNVPYEGQRSMSCPGI